MESFLQEWLSHPEWWFDPSHQYDQYLTDTYAPLLDLPPQPTLAYLVLHDQIPRHKYRNQTNNQEKIQEHLTIALAIHKSLSKTHLPNQFSPIEWSFYVLPVRHSQNPQAIMHILHEAWKKPYHPILSNFMKATYSRLPLDQTPFLEKPTPAHSHSPTPYPASFLSYSPILAYYPLHQIPDTSSQLYHQILNHLKTHLGTSKFILLSLSGGVDSQICSYILTSLKNTHPHLNLHLAAVFINYNNRTLDEYHFVKDWCNSLSLPLYTRHITEIKRKPCMERGLRTTYEEYTRQVRFNTYKAAWNHLTSANPTLSSVSNLQPQVILGHNQSDAFENILTNLANKSHYDNLTGMLPVQTLDNITFHRPLLPTSKETIYQYAHHYGIPYLADSTPSWSQRGKIRDTVKPTLQTWNPAFIPSAFHLATHLQEHTLVLEELLDTLAYPHLTLPHKPLYQTSLFWEAYFKKHHINCSYKSLQNLLDALKRQKPRQKINLNKNTTFSYQTKPDQLIISITQVTP